MPRESARNRKKLDERIGVTGVIGHTDFRRLICPETVCSLRLQPWPMVNHFRNAPIAGRG